MTLVAVRQYKKFSFVGENDMVTCFNLNLLCVNGAINIVKTDPLWLLKDLNFKIIFLVYVSLNFVKYVTALVFDHTKQRSIFLSF